MIDSDPQSAQQTDSPQPCHLPWRGASVPRLAKRAWGFLLWLVIATDLALLVAAHFQVLPTRVAGGTALAISGWFVLCCIPGVRQITALPVVLAIGPLMVARGRIRAPGEVLQLNSLPADVPAVTVEALDDCRSALDQLGFKSGGLFWVHGCWFGSDGEDQQMIVEGFEHSVRRHRAVIMLLPADTHAIVRFLEILSDGTWVVILNSGQPGMFPPIPGQHALVAPVSIRVPELYSLFQSMLHRFAHGSIAKGPIPLDWREFLVNESRWAVEQWHNCGYIVETQSVGEYRPTARMAVRAAWGLTRPIRNLRRVLLRRRFRRLCVEWGL